MSQHINPTPKQTDVDSVNSKIGNVGSTDLQAQITSLNSNLQINEISGIVVGENCHADNIRCFKIGHICVLNARIVIDQAFDNGTAIILSGIPNPVYTQKFTGQCTDGSHKNTVIMTINGQGAVRNDWASYTGNTEVFYNIVYPTND